LVGWACFVGSSFLAGSACFVGSGFLAGSACFVGSGFLAGSGCFVGSGLLGGSLFFSGGGAWSAGRVVGVGLGLAGSVIRVGACTCPGVGVAGAFLTGAVIGGTGLVLTG
jgi:hypothetical protein